MVFGLFRHANGRTDNRVRRSPYSHKGNIGESDEITQLWLHEIAQLCYGHHARFEPSVRILI